MIPIKMTNDNIADISLRHAALIAGFALLIISVLTPVGYIAIIRNFLVQEDGAATVSKIMASEGLFRIGILCLLINAVLDLVGAWALYIVLKPVNKSLSLLSAWFRVAYTVMLVVALSNLVVTSQLLSGANYLAAFEPNQMNSHVMLFINAFYYVWDLGYVLFGLHLIILGYLIFKSGYLPKFLGIFVKIAGFGYLIDHLGILFLANYSMNIAYFTFIGEALLVVWLLIGGFKGFVQK